MSQLDGETFDIDGHTYKVLMLDPLTATDLLADIMGILAPSLAALGSMADAKEDDGIGDLIGDKKLAPGAGEALERAVIGFFARFTKKQQRELISTLSKVTFVDMGEGKEAQLEKILVMHFKGRIGPLYQWLFFALRIQFKDFFSKLGGVIGPAAQKLGLAL